MARIKQQYPIVGGIIKAEELQFDINQLFTTINTLDKDNLQRPGGEFDWGTTKLINVVDPTGTIDDSNDLQVAVTKNYLKSVLNTKFDSSGNWHKHDNKSVLDSINSAGSGDIITSDERNRLPSSDEKDAMSNANSPSSSNPFATMNDVLTAIDCGEWNWYGSKTGWGAVHTQLILDTKPVFARFLVEARQVASGFDNYLSVLFNAIIPASGDTIYIEPIALSTASGCGWDVPFKANELVMADQTEGNRNILPNGADKLPRLLTLLKNSEFSGFVRSDIAGGGFEINLINTDGDKLSVKLYSRKAESAEYKLFILKMIKL